MANVEIPDTAKPKVDRLRRFLLDDATLNRLLNAEESTDVFLYECIEDTIDEINMFMFPTSYTIVNFPF